MTFTGLTEKSAHTLQTSAGACKEYQMPIGKKNNTYGGIKMYNKGFNENAFIEWIEDKFELNPYAVQMITNIIEYAQEWEHVSKDQFAEFVANLLPEVEFLEVARFCEDSILTNSTLTALGRK